MSRSLFFRTAAAPRDRGATAVEYAIMAALIAAVIATVVSAVGQKVLGLFFSASLGW